MLERVRRVDGVEGPVRERHVVHVHDEHVRALGEDVDADDVLDSALAEQVELERVAAADAEHVGAGGKLAEGYRLPDEQARADTGVVVLLRQRPLELLREVVTVLPAQAAEPGPVPRRLQPAPPTPPAHVDDATAVRICVLTTSFPRHEGDFAGSFLADAVADLRARGIELDVVSPAD